MNNTIRFGAIAAVSALALAACGSAPEDEEATDTATATATETETATAEPVDFKACMVSDAGGFDDGSFNQSGFEGLERAASDLGIDTNTAESTSGDQYGPNIEALVADGCDMIITVGFLLGDATAEAAAAFPDVEFAIIDFAYEEPIANVKPVLFDTDEAAYLAGYAAASASATGSISTFGGLPIPSVTIFMDGYLAGAQAYNEATASDVSVLGWDGTDGQFVGGFEDTAAGQTISQGFIDQGADIILPVAGPVGTGAAAAAQAAGNTWIIGVDADWTVTYPEYADIVFTSILKNIGNSVYDTISEAVEGNFSNEPYIGTLANGGVGLSPFAEGTITEDVSSALTEIEAGIIAGEVDVTPAG